MAGNIKSIKKAQTRSTISKVNSAAKTCAEDESISINTPYQQTAGSSSNLSKQRATSGKKPSVPSEIKKTYKSQMAQDQMEAIVANIRERLSQEKIAKMSPEELQSEVMQELIKAKTMNPKPVNSQTIRAKQKAIEEDVVEDGNIYGGSQFEKSTNFKNEENEEPDLKHDRREQLMTSNAFDAMQSSSKPKKTYSRLTSGKKATTAKRGSFVTKSTRVASPKKVMAENQNQINYVASTA